MILTYIHPLWMACVVIFAFYVGSFGIRLRLARLKRRPGTADFARDHEQYAKIFFFLLILGYMGGLGSSWVLPQPDASVTMDSQHFLFGSAIVLLAWLTFFLSSLIKQGHVWARLAHLTVSFTILLLLLYETWLGIKRLGWV